MVQDGIAGAQKLAQSGERDGFASAWIEKAFSSG